MGQPRVGHTLHAPRGRLRARGRGAQRHGGACHRGAVRPGLAALHRGRAAPGIGRMLQSATRLPDGRVLLLGGLGRREATADAVVYDPVTDRFSQAGRLDPGARAATLRRCWAMARCWSSAASIVGGELHRFRRDLPIQPPGARSLVESLAAPRAYHTAALLENGRVLICSAACGPSRQRARALHPSSHTTPASSDSRAPGTYGSLA